MLLIYLYELLHFQPLSSKVHHSMYTKMKFLQRKNLKLTPIGVCFRFCLVTLMGLEPMLSA